MIRSLLSSVRWYLVNMALWVVQWRKRRIIREKIVCFDLLEDRWHRYLHILILFFHLRGYTVYLKHRVGFIGSWGPYDLFRRSGVFRIYISETTEHRAQWVFTDRAVDRRHVLLDADYYRLPHIKSEGMRLPMPLVDSQYLGDLHTKRPDANVPRERVVFFFGNMDRGGYSRTENSEVFGCFSRPQLLDMVRSNFKDQVHEPTVANDLFPPAGRYIVLIGRHIQYIPPRELLDTLARKDFFLAPSGVVMPLCHNLVEAICSGCIPILQHAHLMEPPLQNQVNCLVFRTEEELVAIMKRIPEMDADTVLDMRRNVLAYYQQHLTPEAVIGMFADEGERLKHVRMNGELASTTILRQRCLDLGVPLPIPLA